MKLMVAFSSPKRSAKTVAVASQYARALNAELVLMRVVPAAEKMGIVAQLIATDRPAEKAQSQIDAVVAQLQAQGINATGLVRIGEVAHGIISAAMEIGANMVFVGTTSFQPKPRFFMSKDPIVHYLVDRCPISLCLVRNDETLEQIEAAEAAEEKLNPGNS
ncbi:MAG TPA: universal stress protein [Candidatus Obscuribacterales bacterium]